MRMLVPLTILLTLIAGAPAFARPDDPREDKQRIDAQLAQVGATLENANADVRAAAAKLAELNGRLPEARAAAAAARGAVAAAEVTASAAERAAQAARSEAAAADERFEVAYEQVSTGRSRLGKFVAVNYQGGQVEQFNALIGSKSPREFLRRSGYVREIAEAQRNALEGLIVSRREAKQVANEAALAQREADKAVEDAKAAVEAAQAARDEAERAERQLVEVTAQQAQASAYAEVYRAEVLAQYEETKRESERIAEELRQWEAEQAANQAASQDRAPAIRPGSRFPMPVHGWKSSDYGMRYDPYYHVWQLHAGVDLAADGGDPIYAVADGTVATAGWNGGYGNYTCIGHGNYQGSSLATCYAHQSVILVHRGQWVQRGQLIGRVGTTGASTGDHLHFEVRLDGRPVEPTDWLPGCLC